MPYPLTGAIDSGVVSNTSNIEWHHVVPFAPEGASNNVSSYLYWTLELSSISVSHDRRVVRACCRLASTQVNGTSFAPKPTYPVTSGVGSLAILDVCASPLFDNHSAVCNFFTEVLRGYMAPTTTLRISIPLFPEVGSWTRVSTSFVFNSRRLMGSQAANGQSLVIL